MDNKEKNLNEYYTIDLAHVLKSIGARVWLIILVGILAAVVAFSYAAFMVTPQYSSSIMLYVNNSSFSLGNSSFSISSSEISAAQSLAKTYTVMLQNRTTLNEVIERANVPYTYKQLSSMIEARTVNETEVLQVTVTSPDPYEAAKIANCIAEVLPIRISEIVEGASMEVVDAAYVNRSKISPNITQYTLLGFFGGALIVTFILAVMAVLDNTVHDEEYILRTYQYPVLAKVPNLLDTGSKQYGYRYYYRKPSQNEGGAR